MSRPGNGPVPARIMIVGEAFGEQEERLGIPFVGASGRELDRMLSEAGIERSQCYVTNLVNARPPKNDIGSWIAFKKKDISHAHIPLLDKMVLPIVAEGYSSLQFEIRHVKPTTIIAAGNAAMWALTGAWGITKWRGSRLNLNGGFKDLRSSVIPTIHPAAVLRDWSLRSTVISDLRRAAGEEPERPAWKFHVRPSFREVETTLFSLFHRLAQGDKVWIDFDIETRRGHIACCGLSWSLTEAICIPFMVSGSQAGSYWEEDEEATILHSLQQVLTHPNARVRWQNGLYDAQYTYRWWFFVPRGAQDTMITQHVLFAGQPKSLAYQASIYCQHYVYWKDDGKTWDKNVGEEQLWTYNCEDCVRTREVGEVEAKLVESLNLSEPEKFLQDLFWPVLQAMCRGVRIDLGARAQFSLELSEEIAKREQYLFEVLGHTLNVRSNKQMIALFYHDLGQQPIMSRATRQSPSHVTCDDEALELLKVREPLLRPIIRRIQEIRSLGVFLSTFVGAKLDSDNRMRCSYNICGTETYRFSSSANPFESGTNLQNVPKGGDEDDSDLKLPNVRKLFVPDNGYTFFDTDLSKADLRIVVAESDEREMKAMLAEGRDPYVETAREFYRDPTISKLLSNGEEHPKYRVFKSFSHGSHYLGTPRGLAGRLGLTVHEAERTQKWYFGKYPNIPIWQERIKQQLRDTRTVTNAFGFRRFYFDRIDDTVFRKAIAWIPQSTIGLLIDKIWLNIYNSAPEIQVLLQVHDSLAGQYPSSRPECLDKLKALSIVPVPYPEPLLIPVGIKISQTSWGDCK